MAVQAPHSELALLYREGREEAIFEAGLVLERIPAGVLSTEDQILSPDWLPGSAA